MSTQPAWGDLWSSENRFEDSPTTSAGDARSRELACAAMHLAVAASELVRLGETEPAQSARLGLAEAQFRSLASSCEGVTVAASARGVPPSPVVRLDAVRAVPLAFIFAGSYARDHRATHCSIDPDLVAGAKELLCSLKWEIVAAATSGDDGGAPTEGGSPSGQQPSC